jgi:hypothetical protein
VTPLEVEVNNLLTEEVAEFLLNEQGAQLSAVLNEANERRMAAIHPVDELTGLDENELDQFLMSEEEVRIRERVWVEMNREYLEAIAGGVLCTSIDAGSFDVSMAEQQKESNMSLAQPQPSTRRSASLSIFSGLLADDDDDDDETAPETHGKTSRFLHSTREHGRRVRAYSSQTECALQQAYQLRCPQGSLHGREG